MTTATMLAALPTAAAPAFHATARSAAVRTKRTTAGRIATMNGLVYINMLYIFCVEPIFSCNFECMCCSLHVFPGLVRCCVRSCSDLSLFAQAALAFVNLTHLLPQLVGALVEAEPRELGQRDDLHPPDNK